MAAAAILDFQNSKFSTVDGFKGPKCNAVPNLVEISGTRDLLIASPTLYPLRHRATFFTFSPFYIFTFLRTVLHLNAVCAPMCANALLGRLLVLVSCCPVGFLLCLYMFISSLFQANKRLID